MNQHERMAQMFASIDNEGRRFILMMLQGEYDRVQESSRPALRLIEGGQVPGRAVQSQRAADPANVFTGEQEADLLMSYRAMNDGGRDRLRSFARHLRKRFERNSPGLTLVRAKTP